MTSLPQYRINGLRPWPNNGSLPPEICRLCRTELDASDCETAYGQCPVCRYFVCELCDGGTDPETGDAVCEDHKHHPAAAHCTTYA